MNKKILWLIMAIIIIGGIWYGVGRKPEEKEMIKIGALLPLSGGATHIGEGYKKGIEIAKEEINLGGGINGRKLEVIYEDSENKAEKGITGFNELVDIDNVENVLVAMSGITLPIAPIAETKKIFVITFAAHPEAVKDYSYMFRHQINSFVQAKIMANFTVNKLNIRKVAILHLNDEYVTSLADLFKKEFENLGGVILGIEFFGKDDKDFRTQILKIKSLNPEAIYIPGYDTSTGLAIKQLRELGVEAQIMGSFGFDYPASVAKGAAEGAFYTEVAFNPESENRLIKNFIEKHREKYGDIEIDIANTPMAYDAMKILSEALKSGATTGTEIRDYILRVKEFPEGITGRTIYDNYGECEKEVIIKTVKNGQFVPYAQ